MMRYRCALMTWLFLLLGMASAFGEPRGWLGVGIQEVSEELSWDLTARFGPLEGNGVFVVEVIPDAPAQAAGFRGGDVIIQVTGRRIWNVKELQRLIRGLPVGREVEVVVLRGRFRLPLRVRIGVMPERVANSLAGEHYGFIVRTPDAVTASGRETLRVASVEQGSVAEVAGVRPGDIILEMNGRPVWTLQEYAEVLIRLEPGQPLRLLIEREEKRHMAIFDPAASGRIQGSRLKR
jgi:serine protease Do